MTTPAEVSALMEQASWIRRLARSLLDDPHDVDELVQETWLAALRRPPSVDRPLRGWLATVMRRATARRRRGEQGRAAHEQRAARALSVTATDTADVVANAALHRRLVEQVLTLEEPYRTAVLMRFFEERPPRDIARALGVPVGTVHSRIRRGLMRLRSRLDSESDQPGGWKSAVLALAVPGPEPRGVVRWIGLWQGVTVMHAGLKVCGVGLLGAALLWLAWLGMTGSAPEPGDAVVSSTTDPAPGDDQPTAPIETPSEREPVEAAAAEPLAPNEAVSETAGSTTVSGRVIDAAGRAMARVTVRTDGAPTIERAVSAADGTFVIDVPRGAKQIVAGGDEHATVLAGSAEVGGGVESIVVVARRVDLSGRVVDTSTNHALAGAMVHAYLPMSFGADLGHLLDHSRKLEWETITGAQGEFAVDGLPRIEQMRLEVSREGFEPNVQGLLAGPTTDRQVLLERAARDAHTLRGVVLDPGGRVVPGALVSAGQESTVAGPLGRFELGWPKGERRIRLTGLRPGYLPARLDVAREEHEKLRPVVELHLGGPPLAIAGRVVDASGAPVEGARVWLASPSYFGFYRGKPQQVESLLDGEAPEFWTFVETDERGTFRLGGLSDRSYRLLALHPRTHAVRATDGVPAGSESVELVLPGGEELHRQIAGRVVTRQGMPVLGARVRLQRIAFEVQLPGGGSWDKPIVRETASTDAEGRFAFRDVPVEGMELGVSGDEILPAGLSVPRDGEAVTITVGRRFHVQVRLSVPGTADELEVHDGDGRRVLLRVIRGGPSYVNRRHPIHGTQSHVLAVPETGRTLVLSRGGTEVDRVELQLVPGQVNVVQR